MTVKADYRPTPLTAAVLDEIRVALTRRRWSVAEFARRLDASQSHINAIVNGRSSLTVDALVEWCELLDVDLIDLIERAESGQDGSLAGVRDEPTPEEYEEAARRAVTRSSGRVIRKPATGHKGPA